jgi:hypothetical protein
MTLVLAVKREHSKVFASVRNAYDSGKQTWVRLHIKIVMQPKSVHLKQRMIDDKEFALLEDLGQLFA